MTYTINQAAQQFGLTAHTLRFYDKEGLLPFVSRNASGNRVFSDADMNWLKLICCLKDTGMPIKEIKQYCDWSKEGSQTIEDRKALLASHREEVLGQIEALKANAELLTAKIAFYEDPGNVGLVDELAGRGTEKSDE